MIGPCQRSTNNLARGEGRRATPWSYFNSRYRCLFAFSLRRRQFEMHPGWGAKRLSHDSNGFANQTVLTAYKDHGIEIRTLHAADSAHSKSSGPTEAADAR